MFSRSFDKKGRRISSLSDFGKKRVRKVQGSGMKRIPTIKTLFYFLLLVIAFNLGRMYSARSGSDPGIPRGFVANGNQKPMAIPRHMRFRDVIEYDNNDHRRGEHHVSEYGFEEETRSNRGAQPLQVNGDGNLYNPRDVPDSQTQDERVEEFPKEEQPKEPAREEKPAQHSPISKEASSKPAKKSPKPASHRATSKPPTTQLKVNQKNDKSKSESKSNSNSNGNWHTGRKDYYGTGSPAHHAGLKRLGLESISKHSFKSPIIIDPHIYGPDTTRKAPGVRKKKVIACFNCPQRFFVSTANRDFQKCPYSECEIAKGNGMNENADMLFFWQDPGVDPPKRPTGQLWTFLSWESPRNRDYPKPADKWLDAFNYSISYTSDSDFVLPYDNLAWRDSSLLHPDQFYIDAAKRKTRMAAWWVSNCKAKSKRTAYIQEMKKYIPDIDVYGACGNLSCAKLSSSMDCWQQLNTTYRFYISFENNFCPEYVTEKYFKTFRYRYPVIGIVRGGFDYHKYLPKNTFINTADFVSAKELAHNLISLSKDPVTLGKMYKEKDRFATLNRKMDWCDFCEKMHTGGFKKKVIHDIKEYSFRRDCWDPPNDIK